jgi:CBS domain-containing protein
MQVQDIMVKDVKSCRPETNLAEAARIMWVAVKRLVVELLVQ